MTNRVLLDNVDHRDLKVALRYGAAYGDAVNQLPIFPVEFEEAQRDFPILFRRDAEGELQAVVLLGLDRDENLFLDGDKWTSRHIPLVQQRGPFSLAVGPGGSPLAEPVLHVDLDDPRVGAADGQPLFLPQGGNGRYLDHVTRVLELLRSNVEAARHMYAAFESLGLLQPLELDVELDEERRYAIADYSGITAETLADLNGAELEQLSRDGYLRPAVLASASLGNVSQLIDRKLLRSMA
ncbi:SapC family protein [Sphingomonas psychrotolerans]|uniref:SapC family protein n=1 Tax=Sphingomonas psychrotolerans TaxID=1327635 RepID=A0ABU3MYP4_9SPHN|nr:SapC family protein [Sphingomonas psychrotolerans]MDT8757429.1 SapC family protein [Sphingomonas psychrotolerans]